MKILLIEDDLPTRELLSTMLSQHRYAVDPVEDGAVGLELATRWPYDLIMLDLLLPTLSGLQLCRQLRVTGCQTPILMLTTQDANQDVIAGLDAGADDYLVKSCASDQLLARVRALLRRGLASSSPLLCWGLLCLDPAQVRVTYDQREIVLRPKEYSLLELFLRHPQRLLNRSAIIDHLWSMEEPPVEASVTNLVKDLRQRLKAAGVSDLIETVYGLGYRLKAVPAGSAAASSAWATQAAPERNIALQQVTERFQISLEQRIAQLESAVQSLQAGELSAQQGEAARTEAHKLAGSLGTFGYLQASKAAQAIEQLLDSKVSQELQLAAQMTQLLAALKQDLASSAV
ncbi:MAG: response regulator [Pegethrix bostrychoides GSE-TBD4-15B]|jgi:DNA-binding response OmpR family regulator/HPt (histidine-containing phosphotransfer) domain-containing protein|uniref:Response regulator n=1 Tax=Pegethrix bostrychoides GSE-TBD4-15B TaxID=2839662 RepID=A0A951U836_9CYAN|nr:response regulator [Pegethrix bostrychoides GSE-TBD4-15B]